MDILKYWPIIAGIGAAAGFVMLNPDKVCQFTLNKLWFCGASPSSDSTQQASSVRSDEFILKQDGGFTKTCYGILIRLHDVRPADDAVVVKVNSFDLQQINFGKGKEFSPVFADGQNVSFLVTPKAKVNETSARVAVQCVPIR